MSTKKNKKRKIANNRNVTQIVKSVVARELEIKPADVHNDTKLDYFTAMDATFDLHKEYYPTIFFPEDKFDKYCCVGTLRNYVVSRLYKVK